jgi:two-component system NtrC family sensor kinase
MDTALEMNAKAISEKRVNITRQYGCDNKQVLGTDDMLQQVFLNLIHNALDAVKTGGSINVKTSCKKNRFTMKFVDNGTGISKKNIKKIFDPFFTTKKNAAKRGTGLGLTICYTIIKQLQGDIAIASEEGVGTTITISLPVVSPK